MRFVLGSILMAILLTASFSAAAEEWQAEKLVAKQIETFETNCGPELETYCKNVTADKGRRLACIYAHNDKLSQTCESALYTSAKEFKNISKSLNRFVVACLADIDKLCSNSGISEDSILQCLEDHKENVSAHCNAVRQKPAAKHIKIVGEK